MTIEIEGVNYHTQREAAAVLGISAHEIRKRLDSTEWPGYKRLTAKRTKPDDKRRFLVTTSEEKYKLFEMAVGILHIDKDSFFDSAIKQLVLNTITVIDENQVHVEGLDTAEARAALLQAWRPKRGTYHLPADMSMM